MHQTLAHPISHAEREAEALSAWWKAVGRRDHAEAHRLWILYAEIHAQRQQGNGDAA